MEHVFRFRDLAEVNKEIVCEAHAKALGTTAKQLLPIFTLGNPLIVVGSRDNDTMYCRVHGESVDVVKVLIKNYLR